MAFVHAIEHGLLVGQRALAGSRTIVARSLRDRPVGLADSLAAVGRRGDHRLVLERNRDRRQVGFGRADLFGQGLEAIAVPIRVDRLLGVEVRLLAGPGERDVAAFAGGVG